MNGILLELANVFDATALGVQDLLGKKSRCFYVPAYQRQYRWDRSAIRRLISDSGHGLNQLLQSDNAITFLGTIIAIHDADHATIDPKVKGELPAKVLSVIDGQQRLTSLLLVYCALHDEIQNRATLAEKIEGEAASWIRKWTRKISDLLFEAIASDEAGDEAEWRYYPRMIRAYSDSWASSSQKAVYTSPLAQMLKSYIDHVHQTPGQFPAVSIQNQKIRDNFNEVRRILRREVASEGDGEDVVEFPNSNQLLNTTRVDEALFGGPRPEDLTGLMRGLDEPRWGEIYRLLSFARFLQIRVAVTYVEAKNEEYAFDMFEALNSTGEPLTAIETFKPRVIQTEGHAAYENSPSKAAMAEVEKYLQPFERKAARAHDATSDLLIPFRLAEDGGRLTKRLTDQRRFLQTSFEALDGGLQGRRDFVHALALTARLRREIWGNHDALAGIEFSNFEKLCLRVLKDAKHDILLGPLSRLYQEFRAGNLPASDVSTSVSAMAAFFGLWRGAFGTTNNIDRIYRKLMSEGDSEVGVVAFKRLNFAGNPSAESLREFLWQQLVAEGLHSRNTWAARSATVPIYQRSKVLARLLLLSAAHDSVSDEDSPGLLKAGTANVRPLLTYDYWIDDDAASLEHIAPQTPSPGTWDENLYDPPDQVDTLGNLILLSSADNSALSNLPWSVKRAAFRVISADSPDAAEAARFDADRAGITLPPSLSQSERFRPMAGSLAEVTSEWSPTLVHARSRRLAELAFDRLSALLRLDE